ncbi:hypothetical protein RCS94_05185 [Orbaceae bacterium ac157xtp]
MIAPSSYGALSATSANTIQGHKPGFTMASSKKLGFKVGNITYSEANPVLGGGNTTKDKIESGTPKLFESSLRLNEFRVQGLTVSDFTVATDYYDADGDGAHPTTPFTVVGGVSHKWFDRNGTEITDETKMVGCSGLSQPLTLKINLAAQSHSQYGDPRDSDPGGLEQRYQIKAPTSGICFAKPNSLRYHNGVTPNITTGGGYNIAQFDPDNGFKASLSTKFPTTGFPGAEFTLVMIGNPTDYTFTHNGGVAVTVGTDGKVILNSKPSGAVTITAIYNGTSHEYTFDPRMVWVVPKKNPANSYGRYTYAEAKTVCGSESNIPTRADLTNSPQNNASQGWSYFANFYTRTVGGGVFGEWGYTNSSIYPGSQWVSSFNWYWAREPYSSSDQFRVYSGYGRVAWSNASSGWYLACLK